MVVEWWSGAWRLAIRVQLRLRWSEREGRPGVFHASLSAACGFWLCSAVLCCAGLAWLSPTLSCSAVAWYCRSCPPLVNVCKAETHKTPRGQSAPFRVPASRVSCGWLLCVDDGHEVYAYFRSCARGRAVLLRWAVPCLRLMMITWRGAIVQCMVEHSNPSV